MNYHAKDQLLAFIEEIESLLSDLSVEVRWGVVDNSRETELSLQELGTACDLERVYYAADASNPGYLPSAIAAHRGLKSSFETYPDHVVISNFDLTIDSAFGEWLCSLQGEGDFACATPQVVAVKNGLRRLLNPHLIERPPLKFIASRWALTRSQVGYRLLQRVAASRAEFVENPKQSADSRAIYAANGSIWVFRSSALDKISDSLSNCPLYAEELVVAEALYSLGLNILLAPHIVLEHAPHASTSKISTSDKQRRWRIAYDTILSQRLTSLPNGRQVN